MGHVWAIILGIAQGIAEFLPISSTAHLRMLPWLFGVEGHFPFLADASTAAAFDIALHLGSFFAIVFALWRDWVDLFRSAFGNPRPQRRSRRARFSDAAQGAEPIELPIDPMRETAFARKFLGFLVVTSVPGAVFGLLLDEKIETFSTPSFTTAQGLATGFRYAPLVVGVALMVFGVVLWAVDKFVSRQDDISTMTWGKAALIGVAQAVALIPGVSRSGATMTAGRALGISRQDTAKYSFMAAAPIIGGAATWGLRHFIGGQLFSLDWGLGFVASAITSFLLMRWMLEYVKKHSFSVFMWYRLAAGALLIAVFFLRG